MKYIDIASAEQFVWWAVARKWDVTQCDIDSWPHHQHHQHHQNNHLYIIIIIIFTIIYGSSSSLYLGNEMSPHVIYTLSSSATVQLNLDRNHFNNKVQKISLWWFGCDKSHHHDVLVVIKVVDTFSGACFVETELLTRTELWHWPPSATSMDTNGQHLYGPLCIIKYNTDFYPNALVTGLQDTIHDMFCCLNLMQLYQPPTIENRLFFNYLCKKRCSSCYFHFFFWIKETCSGASLGACCHTWDENMHQEKKNYLW